MSESCEILSGIVAHKFENGVAVITPAAVFAISGRGSMGTLDRMFEAEVAFGIGIPSEWAQVLRRARIPRPGRYQQIHARPAERRPARSNRSPAFRAPGRRAIPRTLNLQHPDYVRDLDDVANTGRRGVPLRHMASKVAGGNGDRRGHRGGERGAGSRGGRHSQPD